MSATNAEHQNGGNGWLDRLVDTVPARYREEVSRVAHRIRDRLPPVMVEHRIDTLERHVGERLARLEAKVDELLRRLEKQ